jgi:DNA polymerase-3 subunit delta
MARADAADPWDEVQRDLKSGDLRTIYWLWGPEAYLVRRAKDLLWAAARAGGPRGFNEQVFQGETAKGDTIASACNTLPMMAKRRAILVRSANRLKKEEQEALAGYAASPSPTTVLILVADDDSEKKIDGRSKLALGIRKHGRSLEFRRIFGARVKEFVVTEARSQGKKIDPRAAEHAIASLGGDLGNLANAVVLASLFVGEAPEIGPADMAQVLSGSRQEALWDFVDALGERARDRAMACLVEALHNGEEPLAVLQLVKRRMKELQRARAFLDQGRSAKDALQEAGVPGNLAWKMEKQVVAWRSERLAWAISKLLRAESDMKGGRRMDPAWVAERVMEEISRG